ncbi:MAG: amidohydrolase family protein [Acidobacteria bacterium]|nr:amidohydrolase family protein [Acidobacteriota bacterium]MBI3661555.1 amidohydrolase family protein [Acidobacteriota bacterium]
MSATLFRRALLPIVLLVVLAAFLFWKSLPPSNAVLVLTHVTVVDATGAPPKPDMTVVIHDGRIVTVGPSATAEVPADAKLVNAAGQFLIPGLWDMHVHLSAAGEPQGSREFFLPLLLANGITGVRDMGGYLDSLVPLRTEIASGKRLGPRIVFAGPYVDGPEPGFQPSIAVSTEEKARNAVRRLKQEGVDFIKVQSRLPRGAFFALADEARRNRIPFAGHVPETVTAEEASAAGQRSLEHLTPVFLNCVEENTPPGAARTDGSEAAHTRALLAGFREEKAASLGAVFRKNDTWQVPTLALLSRFTFLADPLAGDLQTQQGHPWQQVPSSLRERWAKALQGRFAGYSGEDLQSRRALLEKHLELVRTMHRAGVKFLAGTDSPAPDLVPGYSLHGELRMLVDAGLTPMEALQAATRNPAEFLGQSDSFGTVERRKTADLVLLEANPLESISNTRKIFAVIVRGKYLSRADLRLLLAGAQSFAAKH